MTIYSELLLFKLKILALILLNEVHQANSTFFAGMGVGVFVL